MKTTIGVIALGLLVSACAGGTGAIPAAEIQSMSGDHIGVVYYDSISGMGGATKIAQNYCGDRKAMADGKSDGGTAPDKTIVNFNCK
jgi:hypothetical protein